MKLKLLYDYRSYYQGDILDVEPDIATTLLDTGFFEVVEEEAEPKPEQPVKRGRK